MSVGGTDFGVFLKTLIISNSEILKTSSELIQTSSELISTRSELISTSSELISASSELFFTIALCVVRTTANAGEDELIMFTDYHLIDGSLFNICSKGIGDA